MEVLLDKYKLLERDELYPQLINDMDLKVGVEVGVREGFHSLHLLKNTNITLFGVDIKYDSRVEEPKKFTRYQYHLKSSESFCKEFDDNSLDFVYIDANHTYEESKKDIYNLWSKLRYGGIFCGDDYLYCSNPAEGFYNVVDAVEEFVDEYDLKLWISGLGYVDKDTRLDYASKLGKQHEDNLWLGFAKYVEVNPIYLKGRKITENIPVPQWVILKG